MSVRPRVLIVTLYPEAGGVPVLVSFAVKVLRKHGYEPVLAHYEPYRITPGLSVSSLELFSGKTAGVEKRRKIDDCETWAIGCLRPEFEGQHYRLSDRWQQVIDSCQRHVCISGNILAGTCLMEAGKPFAAWIATDWDGDRADRYRQFSLARKCVDVLINRYPLRRLERKLLNHAVVLPLSVYTRDVLSRTRGRVIQNETLPMPIDTEFFVPTASESGTLSIGFTGRFNDPRKNIHLFLEVAAQLISAYPKLVVYLIGEEASPQVLEQIDRLGLATHVQLKPRLPMEELRALLQAMSVFIIPSNQEGLCISALEAMACGTPVVSTRCGGPEQFVIDGQTGYLTEATPSAMAGRVTLLFEDRALYEQCALNARAEVIDHYTEAHCERVFMQGFNQAIEEAA